MSLYNSTQVTECQPMQRKFFRAGELLMLTELLRIPYLIDLNHHKNTFSNVFLFMTKLNRNFGYLRNAQQEHNRMV